MNKLKSTLLAGIIMISGGASAMTFATHTYTDSDKTYVSAYGKIYKTDGDKLKRFIEDKKLPAGTNFHLASDGGSTKGGHALARVLREHKMDTIIGIGEKRQCVSACTDVYMGGVQRFAYENSHLGYHAGSLSDEFISTLSREEAYQYGQFNASKDIYFSVLYVGSAYEWRIVKFYKEIYERSDNTIVTYPSTQRLVDAGIVTQYLK